MNSDWQFWIVIACIILAGWSVAARIWRSAISKASGCRGGCHGCGTATNAVATPLVQLEIPKRHP